MNRRTKEERDAKLQARLLPSGKRRGRPPGSKNRATLSKMSGNPTLVNGDSQGTAQAADQLAGTFLCQGVNLHRSHDRHWITLCHCFQSHDLTHKHFRGAGSGPLSRTAEPGVRQEPMIPRQASAAQPSGESQDPTWERLHLTECLFASRRWWLSLGFETVGSKTAGLEARWRIGIKSDSIPSIMWLCAGLQANSLAAVVPTVVEGIPAQIVDGQIAEMDEEAEEQDAIQPDEAPTLPVCPPPLCRGL